MARLYEWQEHLTDDERDALDEAETFYAMYKGILSEISRDRDTIRRKAVQRARNAMNKELRRKAKEEGRV